MQSSTAIAIRALVMLIVLISVPLFAIFGKSLPEVVKGLMEGRSLVLGPATGSNAVENGSSPAQSSPFAQPTPYRAAPDSGLTSEFAAGGKMADVRSPRARGGSSTTQPASFQAPSEAAPMGQDAVAKGDSKFAAAPEIANPATNKFEPEQPRFGNAIDSANSQLDRPLAAPPLTRPNETAVASTVMPTTTANVSDEKFRRAELRLRELGATQYALEAWGNDNSRYLFVCRMAVGGNSNVNQVFQATKNDPWDAMQDVLAQVEQWRSQPPR